MPKRIESTKSAAEPEPELHLTQRLDLSKWLCPTCGAMLDENHAHRLADGSIER